MSGFSMLALLPNKVFWFCRPLTIANLKLFSELTTFLEIYFLVVSFAVGHLLAASKTLDFSISAFINLFFY